MDSWKVHSGPDEDAEHAWDPIAFFIMALVQAIPIPVMTVTPM